MDLHSLPQKSFSAGQHKLSAKTLTSMLQSGIASISGAEGQIQVSKFGQRVIISTPPDKEYKPVLTRTVVVLEEFDDYLRVADFSYNTDEIQEYDATLGNDTPSNQQFYVVKPPLLQKTPWDGKIVVEHDVSIEYEYTTNLGERTASGTLEKITPPYFVGDILLIYFGPTGYLDRDNNDIYWTDSNVGGRSWGGGGASITTAAVLVEYDDYLLCAPFTFDEVDYQPYDPDVAGTVEVSSAIWSGGVITFTTEEAHEIVLTTDVATIQDAGTDYEVDDVLIVSGGTFTKAAKYKVATVGGGGEVLTITVDTLGKYTVTPTDPVATTIEDEESEGTGCTLNLTYVDSKIMVIEATPSEYNDTYTIKALPSTTTVTALASDPGTIYQYGADLIDLTKCKYVAKPYLLQRSPWDGALVPWPNGDHHFYEYQLSNDSGIAAEDASPIAGGSSYTVGNILTAVGGTFTTAAQFKVLEVDSGEILSLSLETEGLYSKLPTAPVTTTGGSGSGCTLNISWAPRQRTNKIVVPLFSSGEPVLSGDAYVFSSTESPITEIISPAYFTGDIISIVAGPTGYTDPDDNAIVWTDANNGARRWSTSALPGIPIAKITATTSVSSYYDALIYKYTSPSGTPMQSADETIWLFDYKNITPAGLSIGKYYEANPTGKKKTINGSRRNVYLAIGGWMKDIICSAEGPPEGVTY